MGTFEGSSAMWVVMSEMICFMISNNERGTISNTSRTNFTNSPEWNSETEYRSSDAA